MSQERVSAEDVASARRRARAYMERAQASDGSWSGAADAGPNCTAETLVVFHYLGALAAAEGEAAARWLRTQQLDDGSFGAHVDAREGTVDDTAAAFAALHVAGDPDAAARAWAWLSVRGGFERCDLYTKTLLVMVGALDPRSLPELPLAWALAPGVPRALGRRFAPAFTHMTYVLPGLVAGLRGDLARGGAVTERARAAIVDYLTARQSPTGNWFGGKTLTTMTAACLAALGVSRDDPRITRALADVRRWRMDEGGAVRWAPFDARVWSTALAAAAVADDGASRDESTLAAALHYLRARQSTLAGPPEWSNLPAGAPRTGGWCFGDSNPLACDCDTTGQVLFAFGHAGLGASDPSVRRALAWLLAMQNADGGWPAFTHGHPEKPPGPFSLAAFTPPTRAAEALAFLARPPWRFGDPSTEDVTGRVLQGLGRCGFDRRHPAVARAIDFLLRQRTPAGLWWGRWEVNYLAGTAEVLSGLAAVGVPADDPAMDYGLRWIESRQNADGGWGEAPDSYANPCLAGRGESTAYHTGIALMALIDAGRADAASVARGVAWIVRAQRPDGSWPAAPNLFTVQWPWPYYHLALTAPTYGYRALAAYARALHSTVSERRMAS